MYCKVGRGQPGSTRIEKWSLRSNCITTVELGWVFKLRVPEEKEGEGLSETTPVYKRSVKKNSFSRSWFDFLSSPLPLSLTLVVEVYLHVSWFFWRRMKGCPPSHSFDFWKLYPFLLLLLLVKGEETCACQLYLLLLRLLCWWMRLLPGNIRLRGREWMTIIIVVVGM